MPPAIKLILFISALGIGANIVTRHPKKKMQLGRTGGGGVLGPIEAQVSVIFSNILSKISTSALNNLLAIPILLGNGAILNFNNIQVTKCFPKIGISGSMDKGGAIVVEIEKSACYAACYIDPEVEARWAVCKFTSTNCPPHYCRDKCGGGLISWAVSIDSLTGCGQIGIDSIVYQNMTGSAPYAVNFLVKFSMPETIVGVATASLGGLLSLIPGLVEIPTSYSVTASSSGTKFSAIVSINIVCDQSVDKSIFKNVTVSNLTLLNDSLNISIDSSTINPIVRVSEDLANAILNGCTSIFKSMLEQQVLPKVCDVLSNEVARFTNISGISIPSHSCFRIV